MIYEYFRATGVYEAVQGLSIFFALSLQNDDVQDFDVRWDQALQSASDVPSDVILEGLYMALYDQKTVRSNEPTYQQLKTAVKLHVDQMMRTGNFRVRNNVVERGSVTKSQKGKKAYVERKVGKCFQWKAHGQCSRGDSCSFSDDAQALGNSGNVRDEEDDRLLLHPIRRQSRLTARDKNHYRDQAVNRKTHWKRAKFHADSSSVKVRHVSSGTLLCVRNYESEKRYAYSDKCHFRHVEALGTSSKKLKKCGAKGSVAIFKESAQLGCVPQDSDPRKSILTRQTLQGHLTPN